MSKQVDFFGYIACFDEAISGLSQRRETRDFNGCSFWPAVFPGPSRTMWLIDRERTRP
jgi:hypothetical protein